MWPWGHLAVGYLAYTILVHLRERRAPDGVSAVALAFGTQFPDLVDKPLAWTFGVIPNGRSLTHSLITAVLVVAAVEWLLRRRGYGRVATAFAVGYLSHLFGDTLYPLVTGDLSGLAFLAWPVAPPVEYETEQSFAAHLAQLSLDALLTLEAGLGALVFVVWLADGAPGVAVLAALPRWLGRKLPV
ncbi:zinc dependent phospholipase C family protein [Halorussus sp. AFM4]|uniref:zinc dependent phospholipase C family protein n=1 Tax=Halorussus sp. AFM4 TaxID=3421651 RepID=UPI003EBDC2DE